ncbi:MAG TPA: hypothetical protein DIU07_13260 [Rhodobacteraceae bacterium]|nr:hypothetical protein [Paracoccaceae bacterium]
MKHIVIAAGVVAATLTASQAFAQDAETPFGTQADADYAQLVWEAMRAGRLAGEGMIHHTPYEGTDPHGMQLETFYTTATIDGHEGDLIVKRNYGPEGVEPDAVLADPAAHLGAYTVMYRREAGYDPENKDWFWVKFLPDGSLDQNAAGMALAGRVAKGMDEGCIACHQGGGDDLVFTSDFLTY